MLGVHEAVSAEGAPAERRAVQEEIGDHFATKSSTIEWVQGATMEARWPFLITSMDGRMCRILESGSSRYLGRSLSCLAPQSTESKNRMLAAASRAAALRVDQEVRCEWGAKEYMVRLSAKEDGLGLAIGPVLSKEGSKKRLATIVSSEELETELACVGSPCSSYASSRGCEFRSRLGDTMFASLSGRASPEKDLVISDDECNQVDCHQSHVDVAVDSPRQIISKRLAHHVMPLNFRPTTEAS